MGSSEVSGMLDVVIRGLVEGSVEPEMEAPPEAKPWLDALLARASTSRDAALMILAFAIDAGSTADVTTVPEGRRTVGQGFALLMDEHNIPARRDAFQTVAKGTTSLLGRDQQGWDHLWLWAQAQGDIAPIKQAMRYLASRIAATSRQGNGSMTAPVSET